MILRTLCAGIMATAIAVSVAEPPLYRVELATPAEVNDIAGIWQATAGGAVFGIEPLPGQRHHYRMVLHQSPDFTLEPGTVIGTITPTPDPLVFDATLMKQPVAGVGSRSQTCTITFGRDLRRCTFAAYRRKKQLNLYRLFPYLFRISFTPGNRPDIDGAVRIDTPPLPVVL